MSLAVVLLFTVLLSAESLWLFALSAHVARFMETAAPIFWLVSVSLLWLAHFHAPAASYKHPALRMLLIGIALFAAGAGLGFVAITM